MKAIAYIPIEIIYSKDEHLTQIVRDLSKTKFSTWSSAGYSYRKKECTQKSIKIKKK
jgi:hypothetical protein